MSAIISRSRRAATGTVTYIEDTTLPGAIMDPEGGRYAVCCEEHSTVVNVDTKGMALHCARYPGEFCEDCRIAPVQTHAAAERIATTYSDDLVRGIFTYVFEVFATDAHEFADRFDGDVEAAGKCARWMERKGYLHIEGGPINGTIQTPVTYDSHTLEEALREVGLAPRQPDPRIAEQRRRNAHNARLHRGGC